MAKAKKDLPETTKKEAGSQRMDAIKLAMDQIEKQYGKGSIMRLGAQMDGKMKIEVISTGIIALDLALGVGGFPRGRIIEIYGPDCSFNYCTSTENGWTVCFC